MRGAGVISVGGLADAWMDLRRRWAIGSSVGGLALADAWVALRMRGAGGGAVGGSADAWVDQRWRGVIGMACPP